MLEFEAMHNYRDWERWKKDHEADDQKEWNYIHDREGYVIGIVRFIVKCKWHEICKYCASLQ